jgi:NADH-quinone oxidoreductase subunit G/NADP-reducing hydrogenase subunit HndD
MIKIEVNGRTIDVDNGVSILSALRSNGIKVPTLCSIDDLSPTGACRMCVVEVEGFDNLVPACSFNVKEWMRIKTHSPRVLLARKTNVELLLSNHPDDCLYCERNGNCELQKLAEDLNIRSRKIQSSKNISKIDNSSFGLVRDPGKCILCGRCVRVCEEIAGVSTIDFICRGDELKISTAMAEPMQFSSCIDCGLCVVACPTGALIDNMQFQELDKSLDDPEIQLAVQYTPEVTVSLAEEFNLKAGTDMKGIINTALRKIGFDYIFETSFGGDILVMEQAAEFYSRYRNKENLPLITSRCPAWVNYVEEFMPELISNLTPFRSPHQIVGKLINTWFADKIQCPSNRLHSVLITNCTAARQEAGRQENTFKNSQNIDFVISTRELARLIRLNGIDIQRLEPEAADGPFNALSSTGKLFAYTGGELEATLRTIHWQINKKEMQELRLSKLRVNKGVREGVISSQKGNISVACVSGLKNAVSLFKDIRKGIHNFDLIEVLVCPDGCVNGGGQPIPSIQNNVKARIKTIIDLDKNESIRCAHKNNAVSKMYVEFARAPGSDESREHFLANFSARRVLK